MERRRGVRVAIELPCCVTGNKNGHLPLFGGTKNISRSGALIEMPGVNTEAIGTRAGDKAKLEIELPAGPGIEARCLRCWCWVVRVAREEREVLVLAVAFDRISFYARNGYGKDVKTAAGTRVM